MSNGIQSTSDRADALLARVDEQNALDESRRAEMAKKIAEYAWVLASTGIHRNETGEALDFKKFFFQKDIYQCAAPDMVILGSTGQGKSSILLVRALAAAAIGLRVIFCAEKARKAMDIALGVVDPLIHSSPYYSALLKGAKDDRSAEADSARMKHFGDGSLLFIGSNSTSEVFSYRGDLTIVDEHQLCDQGNLRHLFGRRTGSFFRFNMISGNPVSHGTAENQNLHWEWQQSSQHSWHVPCPYCGTFQIMGWWSHFIHEVKNEFGAILSIEVRDPDRDGDGVLEIRPICSNCQRPMRRIADDGKWIAAHPGRRKHGYHLSNLFNPMLSTNELLAEYRKGLRDPQAYAGFVQNQLGQPWDHSGTSITSSMLESVSTGRPAGVAPYRLVPADQIQWRQLESV